MSSWRTTTSDTSNITEMDLRKFLANYGSRFLLYHCAFKYLNNEKYKWSPNFPKSDQSYEILRKDFRDENKKLAYQIENEYHRFTNDKRLSDDDYTKKMVLFFYHFILQRQKSIQGYSHCNNYQYTRGNLKYKEANMFGCPEGSYNNKNNNYKYHKKNCCEKMSTLSQRLEPDFPDLFKSSYLNDIYKSSHIAQNIVTNNQKITTATAGLMINQTSLHRLLSLFIFPSDQNFSKYDELSDYKINKSKQTMDEFQKKYRDVSKWTPSQQELLLWNDRWDIRFGSNNNGLNLHHDLIKHIFRGVSGHVIACFRTDSKTRYGSNSLQKVGATISTAASNTKAYLDNVLNATAARFGYMPTTAFSETNVASQLKNLQYKESQKFRQLIDWICDPEFMICIVESCWYMLHMVARKIEVIEKLSSINNRNMEMYRVIQNPYAIKSLFESVVIARYNYGNFSRGLSVRSRISNSAEKLTKKAAGALTGAAAGYLTGGLSTLAGAAVGSASADYMMPSDYSKSLDNRLPYFKMISEIVSLMYSDFFASKISAGKTTLNEIKNMIIP